MYVISSNKLDRAINILIAVVGMYVISSNKLDRAINILIAVVAASSLLTIFTDLPEIPLLIISVSGAVVIVSLTIYALITTLWMIYKR